MFLCQKEFSVSFAGHVFVAMVVVVKSLLFNKQMTQILVLHHRVAIKRHSPISFQFSSYASLDAMDGAGGGAGTFSLSISPALFCTVAILQIVTEQVSTLWHLYGPPIQAKTSPGSQLNLCPEGVLVSPPLNSFVEF